MSHLLSHQNDGVQQPFPSPDSPTVGRTQVQYPSNNPAPVSEKRYAKSPSVLVWAAAGLCCNVNLLCHSLSGPARLFPVPYKRTLPPYHRRLVSRPPERPLSELAAIILSCRTTHYLSRSCLDRRRSVWTTYWLLKRASTRLRENHLQTENLSRTKASLSNSIFRNYVLDMLMFVVDTPALSTTRMLPHEASPILS